MNIGDVARNVEKFHQLFGLMMLLTFAVGSLAIVFVQKKKQTPKARKLWRNL